MSRQEDRFETLLRVHGPGLGRVIASYARPADQDDLAQDVALALWRALPHFRGECSERTFVFRVAHNRGLSYLASKRALAAEAKDDLRDEAPGPEARAAGREGVERLFAALRAIPVAYRQVLTMALEEMPHAEVAGCLGITVDNVAVRLSRARAALRKRMEDV